jgi:glycosyltransferase involved in cell wall biosynthesis
MISIISVAWNKADMTREFLERLKKYTPFKHELIFTDNGSIEPVFQEVVRVYPDAKIITNEKNIGCPATRNPSMERATGDIVFWLDNDTMVDEGWYKPFLERLEEKNVGLVGIDGRRIYRPFFPECPWGYSFLFPNKYVDWFVGYAVAFKREAYKPIPDWGLLKNIDDCDLGCGIKANGWLAKMPDYQPPLKHLVSATSNADISYLQNIEVLKKWWEYWKQYANTFENWK